MRSILGGPGERQALGRMRGWLDQVPAAVSVHRGEDHVYEYANPRMKQLLGVEQVFGLSVREVLQDPKLLELQDRVYATGRPWADEAIPMDTRCLAWQWQPLRAEDGQVDGTVALAWDVTEKVLWNRRDHHAELLLQSLDAVIYEFGTKPSRMLFISSGAVQVLGYGRSDWEQGDFWDRIVLPEDRQRALATRRAAIERREDHVLEYRVTHKSGAVRWLRDRAQVAADPDGPGVILRGVIVDITVHKQLERAERVAMGRELETRHHHGIAALTAGIALDMEELLSSLECCASLLELELDGDHPAYGMIHGALRRFDRNRERLDRLKAIAGATHSTARVDLSELTRECLHQHHWEAPAVRAELGRDLPRVGADPGQIFVVVDGLVSNGIEAMGDAPGEVRVSTDLVELTEDEVAHWSDTPPPPAGRYVRLSVADQGRGMPESVRQHAFEPYFSTKGMGRGLGMSSALGIAEAAGGSARLRSAPGLGSVVEVLFPAPP